jgi:hypothetical protein
MEQPNFFLWISLVSGLRIDSFKGNTCSFNLSFAVSGGLGFSKCFHHSLKTHCTLDRQNCSAVDGTTMRHQNHFLMWLVLLASC